MDTVKLIAGRSNPQLAQDIAKYLGLELVKCKIIDFADGEIYVEIQENIRGMNVYFIQTGAKSADGKFSVNDSYVEAIEVADACRRSDAASIGVIYATFPYARSDKKDKPRISIMSSVIANGLKDAGYQRIICMDIHAGQTQGVTTIPFDNLFAINLHIENLRKTLFNGLSQEQINEKYILVAADLGGSKRIRAYAEKLGMLSAVMDKQRDYSKPGTVSESVLVTKHSVLGKTAIVVDDMADSMGTMIAAVDDLVDHGIEEVIVIITHGFFSYPAIDRINNCKHIKNVIVTDTIDQSVNITKCSKLLVVNTSALFGEVIKRLKCGGSVSSLFE